MAGGKYSKECHQLFAHLQHLWVTAAHNLGVLELVCLEQHEATECLITVKGTRVCADLDHLSL